MGAYIEHLCKENTTTDTVYVHIPIKPLSEILKGHYRESRNKPLYFNGSNLFQSANTLVGANLLGGNHWTLVVINLDAREFIFMDPKGNMEGDYHSMQQLIFHWQTFSRCWNRENSDLRQLPTILTGRVFPHALQPPEDNNNCGIYTLMVCSMTANHKKGKYVLST